MDMLLWKPRFCFLFGFLGRRRPQLRTIFYVCKIGRVFRFAFGIPISIAGYVKYSYFCNDNFINNEIENFHSYAYDKLLASRVINHVHILVIACIRCQPFWDLKTQGVILFVMWHCIFICFITSELWQSQLNDCLPKCSIVVSDTDIWTSIIYTILMHF